MKTSRLVESFERDGFCQQLAARDSSPVLQGEPRGRLWSPAHSSRKIQNDLKNECFFSIPGSIHGIMRAVILFRQTGDSSVKRATSSEQKCMGLTVE